MFENIIIRVPQEYDDKPIIVMLADKKNEISKRIKELDKAWQIEINTTVRENSYNNNDYLFVSGLLQTIRDLHKKTFFHPIEKKWIRGNREIPYIHLDFVNEPPIKKDEFGDWIPDDKKINMRVKPPHDNGSYTMEFNYYWLQRYIAFLQKIFDNNEETVITLPDDAKVQISDEYKSKDEIIESAKELERLGLKVQAEALMVYANSFFDCDKIKMPSLCFIRTPKEKEIVTWVFSDSKAKSFKIPMKKTIYNTSGFAHLFEERNALISELFINSLKMILGHETAHVARGHWLLRKNEPDYSLQRNVMMNCEINADWTAAHWILNELLYDTIDGNPHGNILAYTRENYIHLMSIRIFSIYLSLSWTQQDDNDRTWTEEKIETFLKNASATHPIYQFRLFNVLNRIKSHLDHMAKQNQKEDNSILTADGHSLDKNLFDGIWRRSCDMIFSFEYAFRVCWKTDKREDLDKIRDGLFIVNNAMPDKIEKIPFYMCYMEKAQIEFSQYEMHWPEILGKLRKYGMFYTM